MISWNDIKKYLTEVVKIPPNIVEYLAVFDILEQCVNGYNIRKIAYAYKGDASYVKGVLSRFLGVTGWDEDLYTNPQVIYKRSSGFKDVFIITYLQQDPIESMTNINMYYNMCKKFEEISKEIEDFYAKPTA